MLDNYIVVLTNHPSNFDFNFSDRAIYKDFQLLKLYKFKPSTDIDGLNYFFNRHNGVALEKDARAFILINSNKYLEIIKILITNKIPFHSYQIKNNEHIYYSKNTSYIDIAHSKTMSISIRDFIERINISNEE